MTGRETAESLANSVWGVFVSRFAMVATLPVISLISWLGWNYADTRFTALENKIAAIETAANENTSSVTASFKVANDKDVQFETRVSLLEMTMVRGREDRERFQRETTEALREIRSTQLDTAKVLAALAATIAEMQRQNAPRR